MSKHPVKIDVNEMGTGSLIIGEVDVANAAMRVAVDIDPNRGGGTQVVLYLRPGATAASLGDAKVRVDAETHEALMALGWSPPGEQALRVEPSLDGDKAIMRSVARHLTDFKGELEAAKSGAPVIVGETGPKLIDFVLSWHPIDDDGDSVEIPLGEPWLLPGTDVKVGEFRLSTREVPPAGPTVTVDKSVPDLYDPDPEVLVDSEWEVPDGEVSGG